MNIERDGATEGGGHSNIFLTPDEKKVFGQLFQAADTEGIGVVTGEHAVKFFEKSGLSPRILGEIWGIADTLNRGLLTKVGFSVALRLIGQAQNGQHPRPELAQHPGPLPRFEGVNIQYPTPAGASPPMPSLQGQPTGVRVPPLTPQDVEKFTALFEKSGAQDGVLQGTTARDIFQRSKLPTPSLIQIWNLADRQHRGALSASEFVVAMHLITCCKNGTLQALPNILPPGLYDAATGRPQSRGGPDGRRQPGRNMPPVPPIPKQFSGSKPGRAQSPLSGQFTPPVQQQMGPPPTQPPQPQLRQNNTGGQWAITAEDKDRFDRVFLTVDKADPSFITGEEAVPFFSNSRLSEEVLAQIWDLADITKNGQLNRDEFAIAMYLIVQQRSNPGVPLPEVLPPALIPPSMRQQLPQQQQQGPSPFDPVPQPQAPPPPKSAVDDLFGLDSFSSAGPAPTQQAGPFEGGDVFGTPKDASPALSPNATGPQLQPQSSQFFNRPTPQFIPTSSFGQSILPSMTGGSNTSAGVQQQKPEMDDLLGDADPEISKKLTNESTELANLSNQIGGLTKQTQELKNKRASTGQELSTLAQQKANIEAQLNVLRAAYEKEAAEVRQAEDMLIQSRKDTQAALMEHQRIEAELHQLQYKHQELSSQLEADRRENENLKERMNVINAENRKLREELEKLENQTRREKGMVSINKKQVAQSESEKEKLKGQIDEVRSSAVTSPIPGSPTLSVASSGANRNPFNRKTSPSISESFASPFAPPQPGSMDDVFGPSFAASATFQQKANTDSVSASIPSISEGAGFSTPATSAPASSLGSPQPSEAPPPAPGNQLLSSALPFGNLNRADSATSSIQVNPASSFRGDTSRPETPSSNTWATNEAAQSAPKTDDRRNSVSVKSDAGSEANRTRSPFAERHNTGTSITSGDEQSRPPFSRDISMPGSVPGAFPGPSSDTTPKPIGPQATGESTMSNRSRTSNLSKSGFSAPSGPDPFAASFPKEDSKTSSNAAFDDAFAQFSSKTKSPVPGRVAENLTGGTQGSGKPSFHDEFPPIEEIHIDSDSESDAGAGNRGFDDDFTGAPGPSASTNTQQQQQQQAPGGFGADKAANFPQEFSSLLPSRTDPLSHSSAPTPGGGSNAVAFPKDDFDDEFGDLTDAKEDDSAAINDSDANFPTAASSGFGDFDPVFDAPTSTTTTRQNTATGSGNDDFSKFSFNIDDTLPAPTETIGSPEMGAKKPVAAASSDDWDAIFADLGPAQTQGQGQDKDNGGVSLGGEGEGREMGKGSEAMGEEEKVKKLVALGFAEEKARGALGREGGDIDRAADRLLKE